MKDDQKLVDQSAMRRIFELEENTICFWKADAWRDDCFWGKERMSGTRLG